MKKILLAFVGFVLIINNGFATEPVNNQFLVPGEFILKFKQGIQVTESGLTANAEINQWLKELGMTESRQPFTYLKKSDKKQKEGLIQMVFATFPVAIDGARLLNQLNAHPSVEYAEAKRMHTLFEVPDDPSYSSMTQFDRVNAEAAWDVVKGEQGSVVIAIVDSGVDWDHPDLVDNIWTNEDEIPDNGIDDDNNGFVDDVIGWNYQNDSNDPTPMLSPHGTHVAGTSGASTHNGEGVSSLSWNCKIMAVGAGSPTNINGISFGYEGIVYAVNNDADIINCSWGGAGNPSVFAQEIIDFSVANETLVVAAAGNDGENNDEVSFYPSSYKGVLNVGSTSRTSDSKSSFSNYGRSVKIFAPGSSILSTIWPGNDYSTSSGTSMASPMAAALAGLVKTQNPDWSMVEVREQVRVSCDNIDDVNAGFLEGLLGKGRINAARAVTDFNIPAVQIQEIAYSEVSGNGDGAIDAGETIELEVTYINYRADVTGLSLDLLTDDTDISILSGSAEGVDLNNGDSYTVNYTFETDESLPLGYRLKFYTEIQSGDYSDVDIFDLEMSSPVFENHDTGPLVVSVTNTANIGAAGFVGTAPGDGFTYNGSSMLFEGGLVIGTSSTQVSNCLRSNSSVIDRDFKVLEGGALTYLEPGPDFDQESFVTYNDEWASNPIGITISQQGITQLDPDSNNLIVLVYQIKNNNESNLDNVHVGIFCDWDINPTANDFGRLDEERRLSITQNASSNPTKIAAVKMLSSNSTFHHRSISNPDDVYSDFNDAEKYSFISSGITLTSQNNIDASSMTAIGPFNLQPQETVMVGFALIGANSIEELNLSADRVQNAWDFLVDVDVPDRIVKGFEVFPNPTSDQVTLQFNSDQATRIGFEIYNQLGRLVQVVEPANFISGNQQVTLDVRNLEQGTYFVRLNHESTSQVRKLIIQ
jgi:serine protease